GARGTLRRHRRNPSRARRARGCEAPERAIRRSGAMMAARKSEPGEGKMGERGNDGSKREFLKAVAGVAAVAAMPRAMAQTPTGWQPSARYPDPTVKVVDPSFNRYRLGLAKVERIASNCRWNEGPVWFGDGRYLLWSDIPNNRIMKWDEETGAVSVFRKPSNHANGNTRDRQGRLVTCEHEGRRVTRTEYDGSITVILDRFDGKRLNSP